MNNLALARITLLAFAVVFLIASVGFSGLMIRYRDNAARRMTVGAPLIVLLIAIVFLQLNVYSTLSGVKKPIDNDSVFLFTVLAECVLGIVAMFYSAYRRRKLR
ncbi:MAG TPA: hypothetical protein VLX30_07480 [Burkholderiales bacterium]|nr:hypothetical protein [Burkholderiales bacterium]